MENTIKRLMDAKEAAHFLSISRSNLYQWIETGKIRSIKLGGRRLFDINDLHEFVEQIKKNARN